MPGKQKRAQGKEADKEVDTQELVATSQVSDSADNISDSNPVPTHESQHEHASDLTKALIVALTDPGVRKSFQDIFKPLILEQVEEVINPIVKKHCDDVVKPMVDLRITDSLKAYEDRIEELETQLVITNETITELKSRGSNDSNTLLDRISVLERNARSRNLRIQGLKPSEETADDNGLHSRYSTSLNKMIEEAGIEGVTAADVLEFSKITIPSNMNTSQVVLVKFNSELKRNKLYFQKKKLKNCTSKFYLNEDLTRHDAKLFKKARQDVKAGTLYACWTKDGVVWAKTTPEGKPFLTG